MSTNIQKNQITEGIIWRQLLLFFFPILLGTFFQQLYNTIDSVIVGQFVGKEALAAFGGLILTVSGIILTPFLLEMMNTPADIVADSAVFLRIYFAGIIFVLIYNMGSAILRATGDSKRPLYYLIVCCIINIVLDVLFVIVFHMGVMGVAVATL